MPVPAYTFKVELIGSRNPTISRTFTIPASWTFYRLHAAIQYSFGWLNCHLHQWTFEPARRPPTNAERGFISLERREKLLVIHMGTPEDEDDEWGQAATCVGEKEIHMRDVWEDDGEYREAVVKDGMLGTCYYLYDFGDNWDHKVALIGKTTLESKKLKVVELTGAAPLEDSGGLHGWDEVKRAFASTNVTDGLNRKKEWARVVSPLGQAYHPTVPTVGDLNTRTGYDEWLHKAAQGSGDYYDPDDVQEPEGENRPVLDISSLPKMPFPESWSMNFGPRIICTPAERRFVTREGTHPLDLFTPTMNACTVRAPRFVHTDNTHMASVLIFIDGVAINEGTADVRAGYGLHYDPSQRGISCSLENINGHVRTGNRAELRAAVAALRVRFWPGEGFRRIVIGTDSDYVVTGACEWYNSWQQRGWRTSRGETVRNRDLWEMLFAEIEKWERMGIRVQFYLLKRELNTEADRCARRGAEERNVSNEFVELVGFSFPS